MPNDETYVQKREKALTEQVEQLARIRAYPIYRAWQDARITVQDNLHDSYGTSQEGTWTIDLDIIDRKLVETMPRGLPEGNGGQLPA